MLASFGLFVIGFVLLRGVLFGLAVLRTLQLRVGSPEAFPRHVPAWELDVVVLLWLAGWLLQLHWLRLIFQKAYRKFMPPTKPPAKAE